MTQINKECLARAWAVIDGKGKMFDECKANENTETNYGYHEGYLTHAEQLIKQYEMELENHES